MSIVVFDLGNVLSDHHGKVEQLAEVWGVDAASLDAPYWAHRQPYDEGVDDLSYFQAIADELNLPMSAELAAELGAADSYHWAQIRPTARQILIDLHARGVETAILSNAPVAMAAAIEASDWRTYVGQVVVSGVVGAVKPDREIYAAVEAAVGKRGRDLLFIDDRDENVRGAQLSGWRAHLWVDDADTRAWLVEQGLLAATAEGAPPTSVEVRPIEAPPSLDQPSLDQPSLDQSSAAQLSVADLTVNPGQVDPASLTGADQFSALACLRYDNDDAPPLRTQAAEILASQPEVIAADIWAAAAAADLAAVTALLATDSSLASRRGGPYHWEPLLYLTYSRIVPIDNAVAVAEALFDAGANPNAGYLWDGTYLFTALTGVFGEGEQGNRRQPRHCDCDALATVLLERGAHPFDHQTLYNRMFRPDNSHLRLLFAHGLGDCGPSPWESVPGLTVESRDQVWNRQVNWAADHGFTERLALLESHGIDVSGVSIAATTTVDVNATDENGATALHRAAWNGDLDQITALLEAGADPTLRDSRFNATALGWAEHGYQTEAADLLRQTSA